MAEFTIIPLVLPPGIYRDGTTFAAPGCTGGQHVRWHNTRCRKMGGYQASNITITGTVRGLSLDWGNGEGYVHSFTQSVIQRCLFTSAGALGAVNNRTPAGFTSHANNNWQFDTMYDSTGAVITILAHATDNLADIGAGTSRPIYFGNVAGTGVLTTTGTSVDGGIVVLHPYLFGYDSAGQVKWTVPNKVDDFAGAGSGSARIASSKIVRGLPARGASTGPSGIFWTLNEFIRCVWVGGTPIFDFQVLSNKISVLSSNGIAEFEGRFFWPGIDRFYVFDGSLRELPNPFSGNDFFDNLNFDWRQKVWTINVPRYSEIWWFYPRGAATECTNALIYNVRENAWYDTTLARSAGSTNSVYRYPLMTDTGTTATVWQHERGTNEVSSGGSSTAIDSYVDSSVIALSGVVGSDAQPNWVYLDSFEPDITQTGDVTLTVKGRDYARSSEGSANYTITTTTEKTDVREQRREMRVRLDSNAVGGNYEAGKCLMRIRAGDFQ